MLWYEEFKELKLVGRCVSYVGVKTSHLNTLKSFCQLLLLNVANYPGTSSNTMVIWWKAWLATFTCLGTCYVQMTKANNNYYCLKGNKLTFNHWRRSRSITTVDKILLYHKLKARMQNELNPLWSKKINRVNVIFF